MEQELLDLGSHPEIYGDGVGDVQFIGPNARLVIFAWRKVNGVLRRCIEAELIRPEATLPPHVAQMWRQRFAYSSEQISH